MELRIKELSSEPLTLQETKDHDWLSAALAGPAARAADGATVEATVSAYMMGENVFVSGTLETALVLQCARCATEWMQPAKYKFQLTLAPAKAETAAEKEEIELTRDDVEFTYYSGETIPLDDCFREELIMQTPEYPLCRKDCRGLCPSCGADLNKAACGCEAKPVDPRLSALKNVKLQNRP